MKLYIDTSDNQKTIVGLGEERLERATGSDKSQQVLALIEEILKNNNKDLKDLTEVEIETGASLPAGRQGSFTGLRVGAAVANTLAWTLNIPVNGRKMIEPVYEEKK